MGRSPSRPHSPEQAIPARVVIGVTSVLDEHIRLILLWYLG